jgi:hypothetical protein
MPLEMPSMSKRVPDAIIPKDNSSLPEPSTAEKGERKGTMERNISFGLIVLMTALMLLSGVSCAGDQHTAESEVQLTGALNATNQFVDEAGQAYDLTINEKTAELLDMPRQKIEIKGTVLEEDGQKTLTITEILPATP